MYKYAIVILLLFIQKVSIAQADSILTLDQISNCSIFLFHKTSDTTGDTGTGTIIRLNDKYFLLTASHVSKLMGLNSVVVFRLPGDRPKIVPLSNLTKNRLNWQIHPIADLAIIQLFPPKGDILTLIESIAIPNYLIYSGDVLPPKDYEFTFLGYPLIDLNIEHFSPLTFSSHLASGLITGIRADTKTRATFFYLDKPSIQGCSGSGVFISVKQGAFYIGNKTLLIGVMHGTMSDETGGKLAAVTPLSYINNWNFTAE